MKRPDGQAVTAINATTGERETTPQERERVRELVDERARDGEDAADLLAALGLDVAERPGTTQ